MERVETITTMHRGKTTVRLREEIDFGYRYLNLAPGEIVLAARFRLGRGERKDLAERIGAALAHRRDAQQVSYPNAGSFFKNPPGYAAWKLIDEAGLRGATVGGAQVAETHANFLVNRGGATARDFLELATLVKEKVRKRTGIELQEEVRIVGE
jgi:UDP-N-acetylmuramate dehydrogenase